MKIFLIYSKYIKHSIVTLSLSTEIVLIISKCRNYQQFFDNLLIVV